MREASWTPKTDWFGHGNINPLNNSIMILEVAILYVREGEEVQFEKDFLKAGDFISSIKGYGGHSLRKCLEQKNKYLLLVDWGNLADHTEGFRRSAAYLEWKNLLHHYDPFPVVEHYTFVTEGIK